MPSATQEQWQDLSAAVRSALVKHVPLMTTMDPAKLTGFIETVNDAMWLEIRAAAYDEAVDEHRARLLREEQYGG